jgi:ATP-dependent exoDNAse (exonuclease V) beta subunit
VAAVQVMTIHKAKGLQGRFVIVYGWEDTLEPESKTQPRPAVAATDPEGRRVAGFNLPWGQLQVISAGYAQALAQDDRLCQEETRRLAYVAATRAEDRLVLLSHDSSKNGNGLLGQVAALVPPPSTQATLWDGQSILRRVEPAALAASPALAPAAPVADLAAYRQHWQDRAAALDQPSARLLNKPSQPEHPLEQDETEPADYRAAASDQARLIGQQCGTLVHRYLELHLRDECFRIEAWDQLQQSALEEPAWPAALAKAEKLLRAFYGSAPHRRARSGRVLGREVPVYLTQADRPWSGVVDLILEEESGAVVGVDYKTMPAPAELPAEYARQQQIYTEALRRLLPGREIRFEFWWLTAPREARQC